MPIEAPPHYEGRKRYVYQQWVRPSNGPLLTRPGPSGVRTPNGYIWGHTAEDFFWIQRLPGVECVAIWSRSMIKELGENYDESEFTELDALQVPRMRHPWPVLIVPDHSWAPRGDRCGVIDEGCARHAQPDYVPKRRDTTDYSEQIKKEKAKAGEIVKRLLGWENGANVFVPNDPYYPLRSPEGNVYAFLLSPQLKETIYAGKEDILQKMIPGMTVMVKDGNSVAMAQFDGWGLEVLGDQIGYYAGLCENLDSTNQNQTSIDDITTNQEETSIDGKSSDQEASVDDKADDKSAKQEETSVNDKPANPVETSIDTEDTQTAETTMADGADTEETTHGGGSTSDKEASSDSEAGGDQTEDKASTEDEPDADDDERKENERDYWEPQTHVRREGKPDVLPTGEDIPFDSPFSVEDVPKLEEDIPKYYFPDIVYVHDPHNVTSVDEWNYGRAAYQTFRPKAPMAYKRVYPHLSRDDASNNDTPVSDDREAHLYLAHQNRLGVGHHSLVHRAALTLPKPLSAHSRNGNVRVAVKSAFPLSSARGLLVNEAEMYNKFPDHLSQDWCGYNHIPPIKHQVPIGPVVPKFFGYYVPQNGYVESDPLDTRAASPILLLEDCGEPVEPEKFTMDDRSECYSLMLRLHYEGILQGSFYVRNILIQPGPLTAPPVERSKSTPSFRIIDFGRAEDWASRIGKETDKDRIERKRVTWNNDINDEDRRAQRELQIVQWNF